MQEEGREASPLPGPGSRALTHGAGHEVDPGRLHLDVEPVAVCHEQACGEKGRGPGVVRACATPAPADGRPTKPAARRRPHSAEEGPPQVQPRATSVPRPCRHEQHGSPGGRPPPPPPAPAGRPGLTLPGNPPRRGAPQYLAPGCPRSPAGRRAGHTGPAARRSVWAPSGPWGAGGRGGSRLQDRLSPPLPRQRPGRGPATYLLVGGRVRGPSRHLHHDAVPALTKGGPRQRGGSAGRGVRQRGTGGGTHLGQEGRDEHKEDVVDEQHQQQQRAGLGRRGPDGRARCRQAHRPRHASHPSRPLTRLRCAAGTKPQGDICANPVPSPAPRGQAREVSGERKSREAWGSGDTLCDRSLWMWGAKPVPAPRMLLLGDDGLGPRLGAADHTCLLM